MKRLKQRRFRVTYTTPSSSLFMVKEVMMKFTIHIKIYAGPGIRE